MWFRICEQHEPVRKTNRTSKRQRTIMDQVLRNENRHVVAFEILQEASEILFEFEKLKQMRLQMTADKLQCILMVSYFLPNK